MISPVLRFTCHQFDSLLPSCSLTNGIFCLTTERAGITGTRVCF
ncbi:hypothetical protein HMPREF1144_3154 [Klebsiella sp. OBRC7]|nr:hypothetical protein HMPREF1144_3154 [Klebsiella sp. OBRC7]